MTVYKPSTAWSAHSSIHVSAKAGTFPGTTTIVAPFYDEHGIGCRATDVQPPVLGIDYEVSILNRDGRTPFFIEDVKVDCVVNSDRQATITLTNHGASAMSVSGLQLRGTVITPELLQTSTN